MMKPIAKLVGWALLAGLLAACASQPAAPAGSGQVEPAQEIVLYNWTDYMNPEVLEQFTQETGIRIVEDFFSSNEEMFAKLQGGATGYSVLVPSDYIVYVMIQQGMLHQLDKSNIPNIKNLAPEFQTSEIDPNNAYCVPYQWGTTGIAYLKSKVAAPTSWGDILKASPDSPQYGRMLMVDDPRDGFAAALHYLGYDINTTDMAQLEEARQLLIEAKAGLAGYDSDTFDEMLLAEEILMTQAWNGEILASQEENPDIDYVIPQDGGVIYMEKLCIPVTASPAEKLAAEIFINFVLRGDIGAKLSEYIYYGTPNQAAIEFLSEDYLSNTAIFPPEDQRARLHTLRPLGEFDAVYQRLWDEVKSAP
jgi:spermidine/putrescine-binding protein